ncbi:MAG: acyl-CoA dehydrogenase family protein [Deltaproteobacteria bacterium]|nr:acyl-CoA dehydrogenase family protein [Deltaproteobacteria bacterium]
MMDLRLNEEQQIIIETVRKFVQKEVMPVASRLEHADEYPHALVERLKEMGLFGATIPEEYGGMGLDMVTYSLVVEEICRGWMSLSGVLNTHLIMAYVVRAYGTEEQKRRWLPKMATGEKRGGLALSEPDAGSDVQAIRATAVRDGERYLVNGVKMWITNGRHGNTFLLLAKTDSGAKPRHAGISAFIVEKGEKGFTVSRDIKKLGYKGIETCELVFENYPIPAGGLVGGKEGRGFEMVMDGLETGRINVAARAVGVLRAAFEDSIRYAQIRRTFGKPIAEHQLIQSKLSLMATDLEASRLLVLNAAMKKDRGERCDLEGGMAKLFATQACAKHTLEAIHIHGGYGYTTEFDVERYFRDAPLMTVGEGTNEIQQLVIARNLLKKYAI